MCRLTSVFRIQQNFQCCVRIGVKLGQKEPIRRQISQCNQESKFVKNCFFSCHNFLNPVLFFLKLLVYVTFMQLKWFQYQSDIFVGLTTLFLTFSLKKMVKMINFWIWGSRRLFLMHIVIKSAPIYLKTEQHVSFNKCLQNLAEFLVLRKNRGQTGLKRTNQETDWPCKSQNLSKIASFDALTF